MSEAKGSVGIYYIRYWTTPCNFLINLGFSFLIGWGKSLLTTSVHPALLNSTPRRVYCNPFQGRDARVLNAALHTKITIFDMTS